MVGVPLAAVRGGYWSGNSEASVEGPESSPSDSLTCLDEAGPANKLMLGRCQPFG